MIGEIEYYIPPRKNYRREFNKGQIFDAPISFTSGRNFQILRLDYYDKEKPHNSNYTLEKVDVSFNPEDNQPLYPLGLSANEFVVCQAHKFRPVVILSQGIPIYNRSREVGISYVVVPAYTTKDRADRYKYPEEFILRVQAYQYPTLFYLPESREFNFRESILRFDKLSVLSKDLLLPKPICLSDDAFYCLINWFYYLMGVELDEILSYYRENALRELES